MTDEDFSQMVADMYSTDATTREAAWARFVDHFGPIIAPAVRMRYQAADLRTQRDTADGIQSVLARMWENPDYWQSRLSGLTFDQARALIWQTACNRLLQFIRAQRTQRRDSSRTNPIDREFDLADTNQTDPATQAITQEENTLLDQAIREACRDEQQYRMIRELLAGAGYVEVAPKYNLKPDAARMVYCRFVARLQQNLETPS